MRQFAAAFWPPDPPKSGLRLNWKVYMPFSRIAGAAVLAQMLFPALPAEAKPMAPAILCKMYPDSKTCEGGPPPCTLCHSIAPARNAFGVQVSLHLARGAPRPLSDEAFAAALPVALKAVEKDDADKDGVSNYDEIMAGSLPGDANSMPVAASCSPADKAAAAKGHWNVCGYDPVYVFRKVHMDFCGPRPRHSQSWRWIEHYGNLLWRTPWMDASSRATGWGKTEWSGTWRIRKSVPWIA
jgi:hypothetical protein